MDYPNLQNLLKYSLPAVILGFGSCKGTDKEELSKVPPNIILILSDDQGWTDYGFMDHSSIQTPNIDRLAAKGMTFTQGYVPVSLCRPSLACLITGLYPKQHEVLGNDPVYPGIENHGWGIDFLVERAKHDTKIIQHFENIETLPDILKARNYVSFQTGKWWEGNFKTGGFDFGLTHGDPLRGGRHGDEGLKIGREGMDTIFRFIDYAVLEEKPFLLWYAPFLPHSPHNPPDSLLEKYLPLAPSKPVAAYWAMCELFDSTIGQLMEYVNKKGLSENTIFVYVCDNGWVQDKDRPDVYSEPSKRSPYNTGIRTPIIFCWEGKIQPESDTLSIVSSTDIMPTLLEITGVTPPENLPGINVLDKDKLSERKAVFGEIFSHDFGSIDESIEYRMTITNPYKLIVPDKLNKADESIKLFNIMEDPFEKVNLAEKYPEVVNELSFMINATWENY